MVGASQMPKNGQTVVSRPGLSSVGKDWRCSKSKIEIRLTPSSPWPSDLVTESWYSGSRDYCTEEESSPLTLRSISTRLSTDSTVPSVNLRTKRQLPRHEQSTCRSTVPRTPGPRGSHQMIDESCSITTVVCRVMYSCRLLGPT